MYKLLWLNRQSGVVKNKAPNEACKEVYISREGEGWYTYIEPLAGSHLSNENCRPRSSSSKSETMHQSQKKKKNNRSTGTKSNSWATVVGIRRPFDEEGCIVCIAAMKEKETSIYLHRDLSTIFTPRLGPHDLHPCYIWHGLGWIFNNSFPPPLRVNRYVHIYVPASSSIHEPKTVSRCKGGDFQQFTPAFLSFCLTPWECGARSFETFPSLLLSNNHTRSLCSIYKGKRI